MATTGNLLKTQMNKTFAAFGQILEKKEYPLEIRETGTVTYVGKGIARVNGLWNVKSEEMVLLSGSLPGLVFNLDHGEAGIILLDEDDDIKAGSEVQRTGKVIDVPVGKMLLGRVVDAVGRPLDNYGPVRTTHRQVIEREAPAIVDRSPVNIPLQTGIKVIDALIPIGRGQRELILGDRQTGKTTIALDTIINQKDKGVICVYCAIGQRSSSVAKLIADLRENDALDNTIIVVAAGESTPGMKYIAPYAATAMAEYFMYKGEDVLIVYDDLTNHARAYRELSLLLRRPPGREAFPGDIFYIHSRLLERSTHLKKELGGGSLTSLPIIETEAQNISAYIPTNLISITDGQIYLSPELAQKGIMPAVNVGRSVSRVGGKAQFPSYRMVASDLRLSYAQFEELERFARFSTRLDESTRKIIERGKRVREILKQPQFQPVPVSVQIVVLMAVVEGLLDKSPIELISAAESAISKEVTEKLPDVCQKIEKGEQLIDEDRYKIVSLARNVIAEKEEGI
ncbi:alternate F1F0 ATPase, F1 subunit alpha [uncultured Candidatus Kuenenia sp.]|jgi:F-type H+-transporting ATPase subunit alpha|uniref:alternate F1F0 ATPase, F1 subunit alpha n=1 Tax=uncultured Candidatus Kuenenia sp. TaxID=1048336 RepID=UPI00030EB3F6|nr:alternate F1F0 ATPase, F1 subunit alpha [uncultured Candidatus Kuenenia sp.]